MDKCMYTFLFGSILYEMKIRGARFWVNGNINTNDTDTHKQ